VRIYLDSAPLIYLVEEVVPYASTLESRLAEPGVIQVCSELTRLECRVKPIRDSEDALLSAFDSYFSEIVGRVIPLSRQVMEQATLLRARYGFRTPDSIHLAAAIVDDCDLFLTNDRRLARCSEITVEAL
jgi:predicted nucleic acid-binding protein